MDFKKIFLIGIILLTVASIACVSAADDIGDDSALNYEDKGLVEATPVSEVNSPEEENIPLADTMVGNSSGTSGNGTGNVVTNIKITPTKMTTTYKSGKTFNIKVEDDSQSPVSGVKLNLKIFTGKKYKTATVTTNANGIASYDASKLAKGTHKIIITLADTASYSAASKTSSVTIKTAKLTVTPKALKTSYASGKTFNVKVIDANTKKAVSNLKITLKVYTGKKYKTVKVKTNSKGIAKYSASKLSLGKHKVIVNKLGGNYYSTQKTSYVKVSKAKMSIVAPSASAIYKKAGKFTITVKHKESKKPLNAVKVTVKVYTGKKYKTYNLKTNKKGVVSIPTKALSKGKHKVAIKTKATSKIKAASKTSYITVKKATSSSSSSSQGGETEKPKEPLNTTMKIGGFVSYIYYAGSPAGFTTTFYIYDQNGNRVDNLTIHVYESTYYESNVLKNWTTIKSGSSAKIYANNNKRYIFRFLGDENYLPCEYIYKYSV